MERGVLETDVHISEPRLPPVRLASIRERQWKPQLDLAAFTEAFLEQEQVLHGAGPFGGHDGRDDRLILRIRLLGHQSARQIEFAPRPRVIAAEFANMIQHALNLLVVQRFAEGRHELGEAARRAAIVDHREPVGIGLAGSEVAVAEIRQRQLEPDLA